MATFRSRIPASPAGRRVGWIVAALALLATSFPVAAMTRRAVEPAEAYAQTVIRANNAVERVRPVSTAAPTLSLADAYKVSRVIVSARQRNGGRIAGFKGGLARPGQQIDGKPVAPIVGVLFSSGDTPADGSIPLDSYRTLVVEAEIAFTFTRDIYRPVTDVTALRAAVGSLRPAVELPDISLNGPVRSPQDLVAINIGSANFILGPETKLDDQSIAQLTPVILRDEQEVARGNVPEALGDPWLLLQRLVNTAIANGYRIRAGHSILAGAIAAVPNAAPGRYVVDFGPMGRIPFTIAPARPTRGN